MTVQREVFLAAACLNNIEIVVQYLKENEGNVSAINVIYGDGYRNGDMFFKVRRGETALQIAISNRNEEITRLLLGVPGIHINANHPYGSVLHRMLRWQNVDLLNQLLSMPGLDVNIESFGITPLFLAVNDCYAVGVKLLLQAPGIDLHRQCEGETILYAAVSQGSIEITKLLLDDDRVNANEKNANGNFPLIKAVSGKRASIVQLLLNARSDVCINDKDSSGRCALIWALEYCRDDLVRLLLDAGADINVVNVLGAPAIQSAFNKEHYHLCLLLRKAAEERALKRYDGLGCLQRDPQKEDAKPKIAIFLDIDGVVYDNSTRFSVESIVGTFAEEKFARKQKPYLKNFKDYHYNKTKASFFHPLAVHNLDLLIGNIEQNGYVPFIVLSSSWREKGDMDYLRKIFGMHLFSQYLRDKIKDGIPHYRAAGIKEWLDQNADSLNVVNYLILDDENFFYGGEVGHGKLLSGQFIECKCLFDKDALRRSLACLELELVYDEDYFQLFQPAPVSLLQLTSLFAKRRVAYSLESSSSQPANAFINSGP